MDTRNTPSNWDDEQLDSASPLHLEDAHFDDTLNAWVLSRYDEVVTAFRSHALCQAGPRSTLKNGPPDDAARLKLRAETAEALSPRTLRQWRDKMVLSAGALLDLLPDGQPVDLIAEYARPLCLNIATLVTGVPDAQAVNLSCLAQQVSKAAAEPFDPVLAQQAKDTDQTLHGYFHSGPVSLRESGFVALSQTLCYLLARGWFALLRHPDEWNRLHREPALIDSAVEEMLRYAGLTRILFRIAASDVEINGKRIRKGERVILRLIAANRDPAAFVNPDTPDIAVQRRSHLALGFGRHGCVGAPLIRMAVKTATRCLLERYPSADLQGEIEWRGGSGFSFPASLRVLLRRRAEAAVAV